MFDIFNVLNSTKPANNFRAYNKAAFYKFNKINEVYHKQKNSACILVIG